MTKERIAFDTRPSFSWVRLTGGLAFVVAVVLHVPAWTQDTGNSSGSASQQESQRADAPKAPPTDQGAAPNSQEQTEKSDESKPAAEKPPESNPDATVSTTHKRNSRNRRAAASTEDEPRKRVVRRGGVSEPVTQIIPGMTLEESNQKRKDAEDLMNAAFSDLKTLGSRTLNSNQQEVISQIHHYMDVARSALSDGDIMRAYRLAQKAQLLSDDLVKH